MLHFALLGVCVAHGMKLLNRMSCSGSSSRSRAKWSVLLRSRVAGTVGGAGRACGPRCSGRRAGGCLLRGGFAGLVRRMVARRRTFFRSGPSKSRKGRIPKPSGFSPRIGACPRKRSSSSWRRACLALKREIRRDRTGAGWGDRSTGPSIDAAWSICASTRSTLVSFSWSSQHLPLPRVFGGDADPAPDGAEPGPGQRRADTLFWLGCSWSASCRLGTVLPPVSAFLCHPVDIEHPVPGQVHPPHGARRVLSVWIRVCGKFFIRS